jgi:hypothetical protein
MLPDFPNAKVLMEEQLIRWVREQVPMISPILGQIKHYTQHEGRRSELIREDHSVAETTMSAFRGSIVITREEMRTFDLNVIQQKFQTLAEELASHQSTTLFETISQAASSVGNTVDAEGKPLTQEKFLELFRKIQLDFDPVTEKISPGFQIVLHPDTAAKIIPLVKAWEHDPAFIKKHEEIIEQQRVAWRARESRRVLVD